MQERGWKPRWFAKDKGTDTYRYIGGYWEARDNSKWDSCPDIFGQIPIDPQLDWIEQFFRFFFFFNFINDFFTYFYRMSSQ